MTGVKFTHDQEMMMFEPLELVVGAEGVEGAVGVLGLSQMYLRLSVQSYSYQ